MNGEALPAVPPPEPQSGLAVLVRIILVLLVGPGLFFYLVKMFLG